MTHFKIVEGINGYYSYHMIKHGEGPARALCGARTMCTSLPIESWGEEFSIGCQSAKWCKDCERLRKEIEEEK